MLGHRIPDLPMPLFNVYPASKFALTALTQTIRQELTFQQAKIKLTVCFTLEKKMFLKLINERDIYFADSLFWDTRVVVFVAGFERFVAGGTRGRFRFPLFDFVFGCGIVG